jgi:hypothetical protein
MACTQSCRSLIVNKGTYELRMRIVTCFEALGKTEKNTKKHVGAASMTLDDVEKKKSMF